MSKWYGGHKARKKEWEVCLCVCVCACVCVCVCVVGWAGRGRPVEAPQLQVDIRLSIQE